MSSNRQENPPDIKILDHGDPTDRQREYVLAWINYGSCQKAADAMGVAKAAVFKATKAVKEKAAQNGWTPAQNNSRFIGEGYHLKGTSTLIDADGEIKQTWVKTAKDQEDQKRAFLEFIDGLNDRITPAEPREFVPIKTPDEDLMPTIVIGDAHIGMRAHGRETRDRNFDSRIAQEEIIKAVAHLVDCAPRAKTGLLVNVGDFVHANTASNTTGKGTPLDVDTRYEKFMRVAADTLVTSVEIMLQKFERVTVCIARGNHDPDAAIAIQMILEYYWSNEPRVNVLRCKGYFHYIRFGKWMLGVHHGDKVKAEKLANIMPREQPDAWSQTSHRMWLVGHYHHQQVLECDNGTVIRKFGTLAPPDAWHSSMQYGAAHVMEMIVFKREGGKQLEYVYEIPRQHHGIDTEII